MKRVSLLLLAFVAILVKAVELRSPDGNYVITIDGMTYSVLTNGLCLTLFFVDKEMQSGH